MPGPSFVVSSEEVETSQWNNQESEVGKILASVDQFLKDEEGAGEDDQGE